MPKRLILTRHAKSDWEIDASDHDRPLNKRGQVAAPKMGDWLRHHLFIPDQIQTSSARRTRETCEGLGFNVPVHAHEILYNASAQTMLRIMRRAQGETVLMIGHNPGIADFANRLVSQAPTHARFQDYPTCATAVIDFDINIWTQLRFHSGLLVDFAIPRELA